jgi:hypothetical protein
MVDRTIYTDLAEAVLDFKAARPVCLNIDSVHVTDHRPGECACRFRSLQARYLRFTR